MTSRSETRELACVEIVGKHPPSTHPLGRFLSASDSHTVSGVPHRVLAEKSPWNDAAAEYLRKAVINHHASPEALERDRKRIEAMVRLGLGSAQARLERFPTNPSTRKGNLAEIFLAEYLTAATGVSLPVYRLRFNPNVDQSMKGDDVLAFDLDSNPVRIIVGESKYRSVSSKQAVLDTVKSLVLSHKAGLPVSLQFVADRLFEAGNSKLGVKVLECANLLATERLRLDYVGLLLSDTGSQRRVNQHTPNILRRLAVISLGMNSPELLVESCYRGLEGDRCLFR